MNNLRKTLIVVVLFLGVIAVHDRFESLDYAIQSIESRTQECYREATGRLDTQARTLGRLTNAVIVNSTNITELQKEFDLSVLDSCGVITDGYGHGSCVAISEDLILTAGHCIGYSDSWIDIGGQRFEILEEWRSEKYDVGFVRINGKVSFVPLGLKAKLLEEVYLIGSPYDTVFVNTITKGVISALGRTVYGRACLIQVDAEGAPGSSGCPLFDINGHIIGICVAGPNPGGGVTLCVPVWQVRSALRTYLSQ